MVPAPRSTTAQLLADHPVEWRAATSSPFLAGAADGSLPADAFDRWLEQDHHFVEGLARAWGRLLTRAPRADLGLLARGIGAFTDEVDWLGGVARDRGLDLDRPRHPVCSRYVEALDRHAAGAHAVAMTAMWAVEGAYLDAWRSALPAAPDYRPFVHHWTDDGFAAFVGDLAAVVDRLLPDGPTEEARGAFLEVAEHERAFWAMTLGG